MKLSDVCFEMHQGINTVADKVKYYECGTPILQSKNITNGILDLEDVRFVNQNDYNKYKEKYIPHKGNILLSNIGTIGKSLLIEEEKNLLIAWNIFLIKVNESKINSKFLNFYFQYLDMSNYYNKYLTGGTVKFINKKTMENIEIPNISLVNQIEIANKLEKVQKMIDIRKKQIEELDELIKSQFVEMFQSGNYPREELGKLCDVRDGTHDSPKYLEESGYKFITSKNIINNEIDFSEVKYISKQDYDKFNTRSKVDYGDILMPMIGTIGKPMIVNIPDDEIDFAIKNVALIKFLDNSQVTNIYIKNLLDSDYFENAILQNKRGGTQKFIALSDIRKMQIEIPPIELQNQFADIVKQIDKQKFEIQKNLEEMQKLQESLMNKYFG